MSAGAAAREQREDVAVAHAGSRRRVPAAGARGVRLPGHVREHARADHRDHERRAARRQERQRDARHRQQPDDRAEVDHGLADDPRGDAGREQHAESVGRASRDVEADQAEAREQREHEQAADEPELLADDREDEVGVRVRAGTATWPGPRRGRRRRRRRSRARSATARSGSRCSTWSDHGCRKANMRARRYGAANASSGRRAATPDGRQRARGAGARTPPTTSSANAMSASTIDRVEVGLEHHEEAEAAADGEHRDSTARQSSRAIGAPGQDLGAATAAARASRARSAARGTARRRASAASRRPRCRRRARAPTSSDDRGTDEHAAARGAATRGSRRATRHERDRTDDRPARAGG